MNELARALSQSIVAEPLAGLAGIYGTATGGVGEGVRLIDKVREKVGYQPETKEGIRNLDALARALAPVNNALEKARTTLGDGAFNATGSPALAAAAYTAPDAILSALGARPAMAAGRSAQAGIGRAVRRATELPSPTMGSPASQIGIFAGRNAKTADHGAMQRAASRLAAGDDPRVVWREEGWMRGPDGHMRFEIDDSGSQFTGAAGSLQRAPEALRHADLYAAYPDMDEVGITSSVMNEPGATYANRHGFEDIQIGGDPSSYRSYATHELQHAVQNREGFARGGNPDRFAQERDMARAQVHAINARLGEVARAMDEIPQYEQARSPAFAALQKEYDDLMDRKITDIGPKASADPFQQYRRLAGEAESRAVQKRINYSPQQRRDIYPLDDYDVPLDELIFRAFAR